MILAGERGLYSFSLTHSLSVRVCPQYRWIRQDDGMRESIPIPFGQNHTGTWLPTQAQDRGNAVGLCMFIFCARHCRWRERPGAFPSDLFVSTSVHRCSPGNDLIQVRSCRRNEIWSRFGMPYYNRPSGSPLKRSTRFCSH